MNTYNTSCESEIIKNFISKTIYYYHVSNNSIKDLFLLDQPKQRLIELSTNAHVYVTNDVEYKFKCTEDRIYVNSDMIFRLKTNDRIYLDYGKIELSVIRVGKHVIYMLFYYYKDEQEILTMQFSCDGGVRKKLHYFSYHADEDEVYCVIKRGEFLGSEKTVHISKIPIGSTALSKLDEEKIRTGIQLKVDVILVPGVGNSVFFDHVRKFVGKSSMTSL